MKIYLSNGTIIECTPDECEELYVRGILGENNSKKALEDFLKKPDDLNTPPSPMPAREMPKVYPEVAVYGCYSPDLTSLGSRQTTTLADTTSITPINLPKHNNSTLLTGKKKDD
jgi:hypothetical protein